jgi:hypothetical protein
VGGAGMGGVDPAPNPAGAIRSSERDRLCEGRAGRGVYGMEHFVWYAIRWVYVVGYGLPRAINLITLIK